MLRTHHRSVLLGWLEPGLALTALVALSCSPAPPPPAVVPPVAAQSAAPEPDPPSPPTPEPIETGKECATAKQVCDGVGCQATIKNDCGEPVTCELEILTRCRASGGVRDARSTGRGTIPAKTEGELSAVADCQGGTVQFTLAESLSCR